MDLSKTPKIKIITGHMSFHIAILSTLLMYSLRNYYSLLILLLSIISIISIILIVKTNYFILNNAFIKELRTFPSKKYTSSKTKILELFTFGLLAISIFTILFSDFKYHENYFNKYIGAALFIAATIISTCIRTYHHNEIIKINKINQQ